MLSGATSPPATMVSTAMCQCGSKEAPVVSIGCTPSAASTSRNRSCTRRRPSSQAAMAGSTVPAGAGEEKSALTAAFRRGKRPGRRTGFFSNLWCRRSPAARVSSRPSSPGSRLSTRASRAPSRACCSSWRSCATSRWRTTSAWCSCSRAAFTLCCSASARTLALNCSLPDRAAVFPSASTVVCSSARRTATSSETGSRPARRASRRSQPSFFPAVTDPPRGSPRASRGGPGR